MRHAVPEPGRPPRRRRALRLAGALSLALLTISGLTHMAAAGLGNRLGRVDAFAGLDNRPAAGRGENFLLVGTDGRDQLTLAELRRYRLGGEPCHCTDTMMLAHVSADRSRLSIVSIPRDTYALLPPAPGRPGAWPRPAKINAAFSVGGPRLAVRTVERLTGVHIDHYLELDFSSFMKTVDALGGVPVRSPRPLHDAASGLDLPAGTAVLDGGQALQYVRARHLDPTADLSRMHRQQRFVAALLHRVTTSGILLDPVRLGRAVHAAIGSVRADKDLAPAELLDLAQDLRNFTPGHTVFATVPIRDADVRVPGLGSTVRWDAAKAARLFDAIRRDRPAAPAGPPGSGPDPA